jgi:hypothetical protein
MAEKVTSPLVAKTGVMNPPNEAKTSSCDVAWTTAPAITGALAEVIVVDGACAADPPSEPPPPPPHAAITNAPLVETMILDRVFTDRHSLGRLPWAP